jgi:hypothetical protein
MNLLFQLILLVLIPLNTRNVLYGLERFIVLFFAICDKGKFSIVLESILYFLFIFWGVELFFPWVSYLILTQPATLLLAISSLASYILIIKIACGLTLPKEMESQFRKCPLPIIIWVHPPQPLVISIT